MKRIKNKKMMAIISLIFIIGTAIGGCGNKNTSTQSDPQEKEVVEKVVYDRNNIKITSTGIYSDRSQINGFPTLEVELNIENNTDKGIYISPEDASINETMVDTFTNAVTITPGKKGDEVVYLVLGNEEISDIKGIKNIEFKLHIVDDESQMSFDEEVITLDSSMIK